MAFHDLIRVIPILFASIKMKYEYLDSFSRVHGQVFSFKHVDIKITNDLSINTIYHLRF